MHSIEGESRGVRCWWSHFLLLYLWCSSSILFTFLLGFIAIFKFQLFSSDKIIHLRFLSYGVAISSWDTASSSVCSYALSCSIAVSSMVASPPFEPLGKCCTSFAGDTSSGGSITMSMPSCGVESETVSGSEVWALSSCRLGIRRLVPFWHCQV